MHQTAIPKLPSRPPTTIKPYKTLPDASKAGLPPKPPSAPTISSPYRFHSSKIPITPSPKRDPHGQKRTYLLSNDRVQVPLQSSPYPKSTSNVLLGPSRCNGIVEGETTDRPSKTRQMSPPLSTNNSPNDSHLLSGDDGIHKRSANTTKSETYWIELQLIHDKLLGGATTLSERDQDDLQRYLDKSPSCISPLIMKLIVTRVTNRAYQLSYRVMLWAYQNGESELLEHTLTNLLYYFDIAQAFDEGLMSVSEVSDLMDCQIVLDYIRKVGWLVYLTPGGLCVAETPELPEGH